MSRPVFALTLTFAFTFTLSRAHAAPDVRCAAVVARLPRPGSVRATSACPPAPGKLFEGDRLTLAPRGSFRVESGAGAAAYDIVCSNRTAAPLALDVRGGALPLFAPVGTACGAWVELQVHCPASGAPAFECDAYARSLGPAGDASALRRQMGSSMRGHGEDEWLTGWAQKLAAHDYTALGRDAERALAERPPHPDAARVWVIAHVAAGDLDAALAKVTSPRTRARLAELSLAYRGFLEGRHADLADLFPSARIAVVADLWTLYYLAWSAQPAGDQPRVAEIKARLHAIDPNTDPLAKLDRQDPFLLWSPPGCTLTVDGGGTPAPSAGCRAP
jgi:hypothetical protein